MTPSRRGPNNDPIYHQHHLQHYPDAPQHQSHLPQAASAQPQYLVLPNAINDVEPLDIFLDPAMGTPLPIFVEKDVVNHEVINALIKKHGGLAASSYSNVQYILVDRQRESGQSLYRQYHNKKGKIVLDAQWVIASVASGEMLTFKKNWGGFKVTGTENVIPEIPHQSVPSVDAAPSSIDAAGPSSAGPSREGKGKRKGRAGAVNSQQPNAQTLATTSSAATLSSLASLPPPHPFPFPPTAPANYQEYAAWTQVPPPLAASSSNAVPTPGPQQAHHQQQQHPNARQPPPTPPQQQQPQPQPTPPQQITHMSQVHHRPPPQQQQHLLNSFAGHAAIRGPWYGVTPAAPLQAAALPTLSPMAPPTNSVSRPSTSHPHQHQPRQHHPQQPQSQQQPQQQAGPSNSQAAFSSYVPTAWPPQAPPDGVYYQHNFGGSFPDNAQYIVGAPPPPPAIPTGPAGQNTVGQGGDDDGDDDEDNDPRGRKRKRFSDAGGLHKKTKYVAPPTTDPASLVPALAPPRRSPTPPTRVLKSTYGGNLFTVEDVGYLKKYIDWCVDMGLVLSLREICERLAVKAPHHTFYSWRRYCNKHKIKLGSYQMAVPETDLDSANNVEDEGPGAVPVESEDPAHQSHTHSSSYDNTGVNLSMTNGQPQRLPSVQQIIGSSSSSNANVIPGGLSVAGPSGRGRSGAGAGAGHQGDSNASNAPERRRSPTPPRSLHRSTTGKGIAFTDEDVTFLVRYMTYRKEKEHNLNMPVFWNEVAAKAPHHSRASWLKYWRRHRHEIEVDNSSNTTLGGSSHTTMQIPINTEPAPKRQRYSHEDDVLLARFWATEPQGTSDKLFQEFARSHAHHPWKGWQEHHRLHKTQIDHLVKLHLSGVDLSTLPAPGGAGEGGDGEGAGGGSGARKGKGKGRKRKKAPVAVEEDEEDEV